ncbi:MAG: type II toxin-antitoxin system ParD family antitoxin [Candidatus Hydrogenedentota bacterium]
MNITLDPQQSALIERRIATGEFASAADVIAEALRLLSEQSEDVEYLREEIAKGIEDVEAGRLITIESAEDRQALFDRIVANGNALLRSVQH